MAQICGPVLQQKQTAIQRGPNVQVTGTCHANTQQSQTGPRVQKFRAHSSEALSQPSADKSTMNQGVSDKNNCLINKKGNV